MKLLSNNQDFIFPNIHIKSRLNDIEEAYFPSKVDLAVQNFYKNYLSKPIIPNSFLQAKLLGLVTRFDNQQYLQEQNDFILLYCSLTVLDLMLSRYLMKYYDIKIKTKSQLLIMVILKNFMILIVSKVLVSRKFNSTLSYLDEKYSPIMHKYNQEKHRFTV